MGWLLCIAAISMALCYVAAERTPISEEHHNTDEDVDHTVTFRNRNISMCKMRELEHLEEQMN